MVHMESQHIFSSAASTTAAASLQLPVYLPLRPPASAPPRHCPTATAWQSVLQHRLSCACSCGCVRL